VPFTSEIHVNPESIKTPEKDAPEPVKSQATAIQEPINQDSIECVRKNEDDKKTGETRRTDDRLQCTVTSWRTVQTIFQAQPFKLSNPSKGTKLQISCFGAFSMIRTCANCSRSDYVKYVYIMYKLNKSFFK
jgi:hypothetical protein